MQEMMYHESLRRLELLYSYRAKIRNRATIVRHEINMWKLKDITNSFKRKDIFATLEANIDYRKKKYDSTMALSNICDNIITGTRAIASEYSHSGINMKSALEKYAPND